SAASAPLVDRPLGPARGVCRGRRVRQWGPDPYRLAGALAHGSAVRGAAVPDGGRRAPPRLDGGRDEQRRARARRTEPSVWDEVIRAYTFVSPPCKSTFL